MPHSFNNNELSSLIPCDGMVHYYGPVLPQATADHYLAMLLTEIEWQHDQAILFGKTVVTKRQVAWYADKPFSYRYSSVTKTALPWTHALLELKRLIEQKTGENYNACLLNLYHNGDEGIAWHSDNEKDLKKNGAIASLSLGAQRKFAFKHKQTKQTVSVILEHGSLLLMTGTTQTHWLHSLPKTKKVRRPRVNLTFRTIEENAQAH